jgi:hypothetical protein
MGIDPISIAIFVIVAATTAFQIVQAKKAAAKAKRAAEARKGMEFPVEGEAGYLPLAYGKVKVGGYRTWHGSSGTFKMAFSAADKTFVTGIVNKSGYAYDFTRLVFNPVTGSYERQAGSGNVTGGIRGYLTQDIDVGGNNEFLFFQQTMCMSPINRVIDIVIDEGRYIDDPALGTYGKTETSDGKKKTVKAGLRVDCYYHGGAADKIHALNFGERRDAKFTNQAWLAVTARLNRDAPQFGGVPMIQALIEGRLVRTVSGGVLSNPLPYSWPDNTTGYVYSNNPAWCLLDYLLEEKAGKAVSLDEIDLVSFEEFAQVCETVVMPGARVGGKFYQNTDGSVFVTNRDLKLYECNALVDTSKPHRENVETLLSCMGDARLVWSAGQYHLSGQYPATNEDIVVAGVVNDDNLVESQEIQISYPSAQERLNHCVIRYHNEFENFKEDAASWPPKKDVSYLKGIGARRYGLPEETGYDTDKAKGVMLNNYGVWEGDGESVLLTWIFFTRPGENGTYTVKAAVDAYMDCQIHNITSGTPVTVLDFEHEWDDGTETLSASFGNATEYQIYRVTIAASNGGGERKAVAMDIYNADRKLWNTRMPTYSEFHLVEDTDEVYQEMLEEDNGVPLETELFNETITSPYHAKAKAEELVRTSRTAIGFKFKVYIEDKFYEPGDFLRLESETLTLGEETALYLRVNSCKPDEDGVAEIVGSRFDWTQLAWNVADDEYIHAPNLYDTRPPAPAWLEYAPNPDIDVLSSGILTCAPLEGWQGFSQYIWYAHFPEEGQVDELGDILFVELGRTTQPTFALPAVLFSSAFFGVRTISTSGQMSTMTTTSLTVAIDLDLSWLSRLPWVLTPVNLPLDDGLGNVPSNWAFDDGHGSLNTARTGSTLDHYQWVDDNVFVSNGNPAGGYHSYQIMKGMSGPVVLKCTIKGTGHAMIGLSDSLFDINTEYPQGPFYTDMPWGFYNHPVMNSTGYDYPAAPENYLAGAGTTYYDYNTTPLPGQCIWGPAYGNYYWEFDFYQEYAGGETTVEFVGENNLMNVYVNNVLARTYYGLSDWFGSLLFPTFHLIGPNVEITNIEWYRSTQPAAVPNGWLNVTGNGRYVQDNISSDGTPYWETTCPLSPFNDSLTFFGNKVKGGVTLLWTIEEYLNSLNPGTSGESPYISLLERPGSIGAHVFHDEDGTLRTNIRGDVHTDDDWVPGTTVKVRYPKKKLKVYLDGNRIRNKKIGRNKVLEPYIECPSYTKISNINIGHMEDEDEYPVSNASGVATISSISDTTPATPGAGTGFVEVARTVQTITDITGQGVDFSSYSTLTYARTAGAISFTPSMKLQYAITDGSAPSSWTDWASGTGTGSTGTTQVSALSATNGSYSSGTSPQTLHVRLVIKNSIAGAYTANITGANLSTQGFVTSAP